MLLCLLCAALLKRKEVPAANLTCIRCVERAFAHLHLSDLSVCTLFSPAGLQLP